MIGHDFHCIDNQAELIGLFGQQLFQPVGNLADQDFAPVFGTPNEVVSDVVDRFVARCPSLVCHTSSISDCYASGKYILFSSDAAGIGNPLGANG